MSGRDLSWLAPRIEHVQAGHAARLARLYEGGPLDRVLAISGTWWGKHHGLLGSNGIDMLRQPRRWLADVLADMAARSELAGDEVTFRPLVIEPDALGVHYIDALLGAKVYFHAGQVWNDPLACDLDELAAPDLSRSEVLRQSLELARLAVEASDGKLPVGLPVTSCPINIGVNLFGQRLLEALLSRPGAARRALRIITDAIVAVLRAMLDVIPSELWRAPVALDRCAPPGHGYIDGCATQLVSPGQYADFFAALDEQILDVYPRGGMIHLCGASAQHIPAWRAMRKLKSVQVNDRAADDFERYFAGLRGDQLVYVAPTKRMSLERILEVSGGRRVVIQSLLHEPIGLPPAAAT